MKTVGDARNVSKKALEISVLIAGNAGIVLILPTTAPKEMDRGRKTAPGCCHRTASSQGKWINHNEMDKERNPKELKSTRNEQYRTSQRQLEADEKLETDVIPKVTLGNHLSEEQIRIVQQMLFEERDAFCTSSQDVGCAEGLKHKIILSDTTSVQKHYIAVPRPLYPELKRYIEDLLNRKFIQKSKSPYSSCCVIFRKKDGSMRLCIGYRELNDKTTADRHPIPRIQDTLDSLSGNKWFSTNGLRESISSRLYGPRKSPFNGFCDTLGSL